MRADRTRFELSGVLAHAGREILNRDKQKVSFLRDPRSLIKFGANEDVDTGPRVMLWNPGEIEVLPSGNVITSVSSDDDGDTAQIRVEGHRLVGGVFESHVETVTLSGQTPVVFALPFARVEMSYTVGAVEHSGIVYVHRGNAVGGVPPVAELHLEQEPQDQESQKGAFTVADNDYFVFTGLEANIGRNGSSARVDVTVSVRELGGVFRTRYVLGLAAGAGPVTLFVDPPLIVKPNSDVRLLASTSQNNTPVRAAINGYYARKYS